MSTEFIYVEDNIKDVLLNVEDILIVTTTGNTRIEVVMRSRNAPVNLEYGTKEKAKANFLKIMNELNEI